MVRLSRLILSALLVLVISSPPGAVAQESTVLGTHPGVVSSVAWSPDGARLASGSWDSTIRIWDPRTGALLANLTGHTAAVWSVAWSPNGSRLASASKDRTVRIWDPGSGAVLRTLEGPDSFVSQVAWGPDGTLVAAGSWDGRVRVWEASTGLPLYLLWGPSGSVVSSIAWSPDGTRIASGHWDDTVRIWSLSTAALTRNLSGHLGMVASVAWSPDGKRLATGSLDPDDRLNLTGNRESIPLDTWVRLWDPRGGVLLQLLPGHGGTVHSIAWSPDSSRVATASGDGKIRVFDAATGTRLRTLEGHTLDVLSVAWSPDGTRLASGSADGTVRVWRVEAAPLPPLPALLATGLAAGGLLLALFLWRRRPPTGTEAPAPVSDLSPAGPSAAGDRGQN